MFCVHHWVQGSPGCSYHLSSSFITVIIIMNSMIIDHGHHHHCHNHSPTLGHQDCLSDVDANPAKRKPNCRNSHIAKSTVHAAIEHPDVGYNVIQYRSYQHSAAKFANITISPHNISIVHPNLVFAKSTLYLIFLMSMRFITRPRSLDSNDIFGFQLILGLSGEIMVGYV